MRHHHPNPPELEGHIAGLISYCGDDPEREGMRQTPQRVRRAFEDLTCGYHQDPKVILGVSFEEKYDEMVVVSKIPFWSLCEHHLMPFHGTVSVGYLPDGRVVGLSKIPRLVECFARRFQIQERLTKQIAGAMDSILKPRGVGVVVEAEHLCMKARGARSEGVMRTSCLLGAMRESAQTRAEFLGLA